MLIVLCFLACQSELDSQAALEKRKLAFYEKTLEKNPADPAANLVLGKFWAFYVGDWSRGLPRLEAGSDDRLRQVATADLALANAPGEAATLVVADWWWEYSEKQTGRERVNVAERAASWYRKVYVGMADPKRKALVFRRLEKTFALRPVRDVKVLAGDGWQDSGIELVTGQRVKIQAVGKWKEVDEPDEAKWVDWRGYPGVKEKTAPLPTGALMSLIVRVGEKGKLGEAAKVGILEAPEGGGVVQFRPNDQFLTDNRGDLIVRVEWVAGNR